MRKRGKIARKTPKNAPKSIKSTTVQNLLKIKKKCEVACGDVFAGTLLAGIFKKTQNCFWDLKADDLPELLELASLEASKVLLNFGL